MSRAAYSSLAFAFFLALPSSADPPKPQTVGGVELSRYVGLWYEIAKIPNRFQDQCVRGTTAKYELRDDGRIDVINSCFEEDGSRDEAKGLARVVDAETNARLEVSFVSFLGWRPFWGDYWILGLDDDYRWAVVGSPDRKYGWVLAREPKLDEGVLKTIFEILEANGYSEEDFEMSPQDEALG